MGATDWKGIVYAVLEAIDRDGTIEPLEAANTSLTPQPKLRPAKPKLMAELNKSRFGFADS